MIPIRAPRGVAALLVSTSIASASPITAGDFLFPIISSSSIQEMAPGLSSTVQTIPLPAGYTYTTGQETSVIVRSSDHHIFTNVPDNTSGTSVPAVLELDKSGVFVAVKDNALPTGGNIEQLVFDLSAPTFSTVLAGVSGLSSHEVDTFDPEAGPQGTKFGLAGALFKGLAIDSSGLIYASDAATGKVEQYTSAGAFLKDFAGPESDHTLTGMTFDTSGNLYVTQFTSSDVLKFSSAGALLGTFSTDIDIPPGVFFNSGDTLLYIPAGGSDFVVTMRPMALPRSPLSWHRRAELVSQLSCPPSRGPLRRSRRP